MTRRKLHAFTPRQAGQAGAHAKWIKVKRPKPSPVLKIPASEVEIVGPMVCDAVPDKGACRWIEGEDDQRWCGQPADGTWCCYHAGRVYAGPAAVERVSRWHLDGRK